MRARNKIPAVVARAIAGGSDFWKFGKSKERAAAHMVPVIKSDAAGFRSIVGFQRKASSSKRREGFRRIAEPIALPALHPAAP